LEKRSLGLNFGLIPIELKTQKERKKKKKKRKGRRYSRIDQMGRNLLEFQVPKSKQQSRRFLN
jgi:hypothetical protein